MNTSSVSDDFFEDGLYYLKKSIRLLAESSSKQRDELSGYGLLEELCDDIRSNQVFVQSDNFSEEAHSVFLAITDRLNEACEILLGRSGHVLSLNDFETQNWLELRELSKKLLFLLEKKPLD